MNDHDNNWFVITLSNSKGYFAVKKLGLIAMLKIPDIQI